MGEPVSCPIWGTLAELVRGRIGDNAQLVSPRAGGLYGITDTATEMVGDLKPSQKAVITTWLVDQRRAGTRIPIINSEVLGEILHSGRPMRFSQQRERFFQYLLSKNYRPGASFQFESNSNANSYSAAETTAWVGAESQEETKMLLRELAKEGHFDEDQFFRAGWIILTSKGYEKLEELEATRTNSRQVFVAMWFNQRTEDAWSKGISPAITQAGYEPIRIDKTEHNGKIDDEIVARIKQSKFIVADFTCGTIQADGKSHVIHRGGVYYEAGLGHGLNIPVIFSVREDLIDFVHFDTRQFAHIVWQNAEDLRAKLYNRIIATIGEGPGAPGSRASGT